MTAKLLRYNFSQKIRQEDKFLYHRILNLLLLWFHQTAESEMKSVLQSLQTIMESSSQRMIPTVIFDMREKRSGQSSIMMKAAG